MKKTLFIFDWDNTVLPTRVMQKSPGRLDAEWRNKFAYLQHIFISVMQMCRSYGDVAIISNSPLKRVKKSMRQLMPAAADYVSRNKVTVLSGRGTKDKDSTTRWEWKSPPFLDVVLRTSSNNVISIGDGYVEIYAANGLRNRLPGALIKTLQFKKKPTLADLERQFEWLRDHLHVIVHCDEPFHCLAKGKPPALHRVKKHIWEMGVAFLQLLSPGFEAARPRTPPPSSFNA